MINLQVKQWFLCSLLFWSADLWAQDFDQLSPEVQNVLQSFEKRWDEIGSQRKARLINGAEQLLNLDNDDRRVALARLREWQSFSPAERTELNEQIRSFSDLSDEQRLQLRQAFENYQSLKTEQRAELRELYQQMSPAQRERLRQILRNR